MLFWCVMQTVQRTVLCMGRKQEAVENVPVGNTVRMSQYVCSAYAPLYTWLANLTMQNRGVCVPCCDHWFRAHDARRPKESRFTYHTELHCRPTNSSRSCSCSCQVALVGLDQFITKNATLTDEKNDDAHTIKAMKFSVSPVVRVAVETKVPLVQFLTMHKHLRLCLQITRLLDRNPGDLSP